MKILRNKNSARCAKIFLILFCVSVSSPATAQKTGKSDLAGFEKSISEGNFSAVERRLLDFVIANPKDANGFVLLAKLRLGQNRLGEAKSLALKALSINPDLPAAKMNLALVNFQTGEIEQSRAVLSTVSDAEISDPALRLELAQTFALIGDCPKALSLAVNLPAEIKNGGALPLRAVCYLESGERENFAALLPLARLAAEQNPAAALKFAEVLSNAALHREAADLLRLLAAAAPDDAAALLLLAKSEVYLKDFAGAEIHLARAEKIEPASAQLFFVKSLLEGERGNPARSMEFLEQARAKKPSDTSILTQFVITAMRAGQAAKAVSAAENLLKIQPESADFLYLHGAASLQNNNLEKAEISLKKFLALSPRDARGCLALGLTYAAQAGKLAQAREQLLGCIELNPKNYEALYQLGLSYKTQGETAKAIEFLEDVVKLAPDYALALRDLGAVYLQAGAESKARAALEKSVAIDPDDADTHFQLSRLYNLIGEGELARKHLEIFQKLKNPSKSGM